MRKPIVLILVFVLIASALYASADEAAEKPSASDSEADGALQIVLNTGTATDNMYSYDSAAIYGNSMLPDEPVHIKNAGSCNRNFTVFRVACERDEKPDYRGRSEENGRKSHLHEDDDTDQSQDESYG